MKRLIREIKYWGQIFLLPVYGLSYLFPRSKKIWVFGSTFGKRFADNPKYFYLYTSQKHSEQIKSIWISKSREIVRLLKKNKAKGYYLYSMQGIWYSLRAKVYFYDNYSKDICFPLSGGAIKINLWHGIPLKKIQKDNRFDFVRNPRSRLESFRWLLRRVSDEKNTDYILATSKFMRPYFSSAFRTQRVICCGYPRNDLLQSDNISNIYSDVELSLDRALREQKGDRKIVFYMPTFRDSETKFFEVISLQRMNKFLHQAKILLIVKLHTKSKLHKEFLKIVGNNIIVMDAMADIYPALKQADLLITDYSSIYFDFLLTGKPVIFFPYDIEDYLRDSREFYFDYDTFTPGKKVFTQEQLEQTLITIDSNKTEADKILNLVFDEPGKATSEDLFHKIVEIVKL